MSLEQRFKRLDWITVSCQGYEYRFKHSLFLRFVTIVEEEKGGGEEEHPPQDDDKGAKHEGISQAQELP